MSRVNPQAAYLARSFSGSRPLSYTAENADGGANWAYLSCRARPFRLFRRVAAAPSRVPRGLLRLHIRAAFCLDENPRLSACTRIAYQRSEPIFRTSYRNTRERTYAAFSHTAAFSIHDIVLATRLSLDTHRRSFCYTSSSAIVRAHTPILVLTSKKAPAHTPTISRSAALPRISCAAHHKQRPLHGVQHNGSARSAPRLGSRYTGAIAPSPHHQPPMQHTFHAAHATHVAFIASPRTATLFTVQDPIVYRLKHTPAVLHGTTFTTSSRVSSRQDSPRLRPRFRAFQHDTDHLSMWAVAPHRPDRVDLLPARRHRLQRLSTLRPNPAPVGHPKYYVEHHRSAHLVRRGFPISRALHRLPARRAHPLRRRPPPSSSAPRMRRGGSQIPARALNAWHLLLLSASTPHPRVPVSHVIPRVRPSPLLITRAAHF
ncbi:hypothetical protein DFH08DRAFT_1089441 [Mycena albidolilacea]|uniref:Uncharacterized protein n=1 Tax=Mycena albidolilacea TaxID=1033008 RepID=A0AAD6Z1G0_9AGAR|nr:hypothetical protein DFH08DRAFT_1089441 [Mycena albidolilacea]